MGDNIAMTEADNATFVEDLENSEDMVSEVTFSSTGDNKNEWTQVDCDLTQVINGVMLDPSKTKAIYTLDAEGKKNKFYLMLGFKGINRLFTCSFKDSEKLEKFAQSRDITIPAEYAEKSLEDEDNIHNGSTVNDCKLWKDYEEFNKTFTTEKYKEANKVFYVSEFSEQGAFFHIVLMNDGSIKTLLADSQCSARLYYQCKENNIPLEYKSDERYFHNVIDLHSEMEKEIQVENAFNQIQKAMETDEMDNIEDTLTKYQNLVSDMVDKSDPVSVMFNLAKEYKQSYTEFQSKYGDTPDVEIPEDAKDNPELLKEKYPEVYEKVKEGGEQYIKDCEALKLAETKFKIIESMNKQLIAETQSQYNFDKVYEKLQKFLANAKWNEDKNAEFLYTTMLKSYDQSITLEPMMSFEKYSKTNPGKTFYTMYDQYDKVVNRVRGRMEREPQFSFIDPVIVIPRIKAIIESDPDNFSNLSPTEGAILFYYLFCKTIDNSKKDYVKENGLFILKLTQHFAHFYDGKDPLSRRDELLENIKKVLKLIRDDIAAPEGIAKYGKVYKNKNLSTFLNEQYAKFEEFAKKKRKEIAKKNALKNLTERSMVEEEDNPLAPQSEDTE